jgi:ribonucleoside-triphosphate reductase (thioredoxin)
MHLTPSFLEQYRNRPDPFKSLLSRSVYKSKYQRKEDLGWAQTIARVVQGNCAKDPSVTMQEAEYLYDILFNQYASPAGRGLYTSGTNITGDAAYNCRITGIRSIEDWSWIFRILMCGSGIGVDLSRISELPVVQYGDSNFVVSCRDTHPDFDEVKPDTSQYLTSAYVVDDSREGWAEALLRTLQGAFEGRHVTVDVSKVRSRGSPLITFGGVASGSAPLVTLLRRAHSIVRKAQGRKLSEVECLDITTLIGLAVKAGNVRRAALLIMGSMTNQEFLDAKLEYSDELSHRQSANNSVGLQNHRDVDFLVENSYEIANRVALRGEPAFINLSKFRETDPNVICTNACSEIGDWYRGACCLGLLVLPKLVTLNRYEQLKVTKAMTRYLIRERLNQHSDEISESVRKQTMRIGLSVTGVTDVDFFDYAAHSSMVDSEAYNYAHVLNVKVPIKTRCVQPAGTTGIITGTSPGMHSTWSEYMIRRTRIGIEEPMAQSLIEAHVPFEYCIYDQTGRTLVFEHPVYTKSRSYAVSETTRSQLERQLFLQENWADNAVSGTISFNKNNVEELAGLISEFVPKLKCSSFLPNDGGTYKQAPMEEITKDEFEKRWKEINHSHPLVQADDAMQFGECQNGSCPSR